MVLAPICPERKSDLRAMLATMTGAPGMAEPGNELFPFARFTRLHVARFVILDDMTLADLAPDDPLRGAPTYLAFLGDCDGSADMQLAEFAMVAGVGLRRIFSCCANYSSDVDLLQWMRANSTEPAAQYVNWVGRTVGQIREEQELHCALREFLRTEIASLADLPPSNVRDRMVDFHANNGPALTPPEPTPADWWFGNVANLILFPLVLLMLSPFILIISPLFIWQLRRLEKTDPVIAPRPGAAQVAALARIEDHDVTNQFSAFGCVKLGLFRLLTLRFVFEVLNFSTRHIYTRGTAGACRHDPLRLLGVHRQPAQAVLRKQLATPVWTAIWTISSNKVAYGLNLVFSTGIGYPRTSFLVSGGAGREMEFKYYLRRHVLPTQVLGY